METSTRKPLLGSVRSRHIAKNPSMSAVATPTPTRAHGAFPLPSTRAARGTFLRKSRKNQPEGYSGPLSSPTSQYKTTRYGEDTNHPRFKGFHNAFVDAEPVMAKSLASGEGGSPEANQRSDPFLTPPKAKATVVHDGYVQDSAGGNEGGSEVDGQLQFDWWEEDVHQESGKTGEGLMVVDQNDRELSLQPVGRMNEGDMTVEDNVDCSEEVRLLYGFCFPIQRNELMLLIFKLTVTANRLYSRRTSKQRIDSPHSPLNDNSPRNAFQCKTRIHDGMSSYSPDMRSKT
jgi:hypothetical protein